MRGASAPLLGLLVLMLAQAPAAAQRIETAPPEAISLTMFLADLDRLMSDVRTADRAADAPALAAAIPATWHVAVGSQQPAGPRLSAEQPVAEQPVVGPRFSAGAAEQPVGPRFSAGAVAVSSRWLTGALLRAPERPDSWPATRAAIERRLTEIRSHASALADSGGTPEHAQARTAVEGILAREEFQQSATAAWRERWQRRIGEWFQDLWSRFGGRRLAGPGTARAFAWIAALGALIGLSFWLALTLQRPRGTSLNLGLGSPARPRARDWALRALTAARAGQTRETVRAAYNAALLRLEEEGAWRVDEARTPREYLRLLRSDHLRRPVIIDLTQRFEQIWYGNRPVSTDDARNATTHLETLGCLRAGERAI